MLSGISDVKLANVYFPNVNKNNQDVKELVCSSQKAEYLLTTSINTSVRWQYIGTYNGVFRGYPGQKNCANYDFTPEGVEDIIRTASSNVADYRECGNPESLNMNS